MFDTETIFSEDYISESYILNYYIKYPSIQIQGINYEIYELKNKKYYYIFGYFEMIENKRKFKIIQNYDSDTHLDILEIKDIFFKLKIGIEV